MDLVSFPGVPVSTQADVGAILKINFGNRRRRTVMQGDFYPEGVWGMAFAPLSTFQGTPLLDSLVKSWDVPNIFSHCLATSGKGGELLIGDVLPFKGQMTWTPMVAVSFYSVQMLDLKVGETSLGLPPVTYNTKNCIVDSGTPTVTVPPKVFAGIQALLLNSCNSSNPLKGVCGVDPGKSIFDGPSHHSFYLFHFQFQVFASPSHQLKFHYFQLSPLLSRAGSVFRIPRSPTYVASLTVRSQTQCPLPSNRIILGSELSLA